MIECNDTALLDFLKQYQWGACECGRPGDRFIPVRELSFRVCDRCRTRWIAGKDRDLSRRPQTEEDLELAGYWVISGDPPAWAQEALEDLIERQRDEIKRALARWWVSARN